VTGLHVICLPAGAPSIRQKVPLVRARKLEGRIVEVRLSVRSRAPGQRISLGLSSGDGRLVATMQPVSAAWSPVGFGLQAPRTLDGLWLEMSAPPGGGTVEVDGVVLRRQGGRNEIRNGT